MKQKPSFPVLVGMVLLGAACGLTPTGPLPAGRGTTSRDSLVSAGLVRTYAVHIPEGAEPGHSLPVLIGFHGAGGTGDGMAALVGIADADHRGYLAVYPDAAPGTRGTWALGCPNCTWADVAGIDDYRFVGDLLDALRADYPIDDRRVFLAGFSLGGSMAYDAACRLSDRLAGAAIVASLPSPEELVGCHVTHPLRIIIINGDADPNIPWVGGGPYNYLSADSAAGLWRQWNHGEGSVTLVRIAGGGHAWRSGDFDATTLLGESFFP